MGKGEGGGGDGVYEYHTARTHVQLRIVKSKFLHNICIISVHNIGRLRIYEYEIPLRVN